MTKGEDQVFCFFTNVHVYVFLHSTTFFKIVRKHFATSEYTFSQFGPVWPHEQMKAKSFNESLVQMLVKIEKDVSASMNIN